MGVMQPEGAAGVDLEPTAWGGRFPVQVRFRLAHPTAQVLSLPEAILTNVLRYRSGSTRFDLLLRGRALEQLVNLFATHGVPRGAGGGPGGGVPGMQPHSSGWPHHQMPPWAEMPQGMQGGMQGGMQHRLRPEMPQGMPHSMPMGHGMQPGLGLGMLGLPQPPLPPEPPPPPLPPHDGSMHMHMHSLAQATLPYPQQPPPHGALFPYQIQYGGPDVGGPVPLDPAAGLTLPSYPAPVPAGASEGAALQPPPTAASADTAADEVGTALSSLQLGP